jgi:hypothetical protein
MSEYQYYEFQALDRALTDEEQADVARLSSRVELSPHRAVFTYSYGDFRGDPVKLLAKYFDAMLYLANWGSRQLYFRIPQTLVKESALAPYCVADAIFTQTSGEHVILGICLDEEGGFSGWIEGEEYLSGLIPLRRQILEGDYRALYLAWLKANEFADDSDENHSEPPVPAGLRNLPKPLREFVDLFEIDNDLLAVAAEASADAPVESDAELEQWIARLSESERESYLLSLIRGEVDVPMQLRLRLKEIAREHRPAASNKEPPPRRSRAELGGKAKAIQKNRAELERRALEEARVRKLETLAKREPQLWDQVMSLIAQKQIKAYDQAVEILKDLRELAADRHQSDRFVARVEEIQQTRPSLSGLRSRLKTAGLLAKSS